MFTLPQTALSRALKASVFAFVTLFFFALGFAAEPVKTYDIKAGDAESTLKAFADQSGRSVFFSPNKVRGVTTNAVKGELTVEQALDQLLSQTPLTAVPEKGTGGFAVRREASVEIAEKNGQRAAQTKKSDRPITTATTEETAVTLDTFTVTGSRIRGARLSSPQVAITQEEIRLSGFTNLGEAMRALPQNFNGGQNPEMGQSAQRGGETNQNYSGGSSVNLRGLGPDATLTLLNGKRLPYDGLYQATDVSAIPVGAVERIEVFLDGASAIYGSDAVGGVVNVILKRDFKGAEISGRYGGATSGGYVQTAGSVVAGTVWRSGGLIVTGDVSHNTTVKAGQRDFLSYLPNQNITIYPRSTQSSILLSGHQKLGEMAEFSLDTYYTERRQKSINQSSILFISEPDSVTWGASPSVQFTLPGDWSLGANATIGRSTNDFGLNVYSVATGALIAQSPQSYRNKSEAYGIDAEGPVLVLSSGKVRVAAGLGYRENSFDQINLLTGAPTVAGLDRSKYAYGEINIPIIGKNAELPLVTDLSINGAVRYEDYDSFGETTTPKVGVVLELVRQVEFKASWGKSFKVPTLLQQFGTSSVYLYPATSFGGPVGRTILYSTGGRRDLAPERAETLTVGIAIHPKAITGLTLELNRFDIDYRDRISAPINPLSQALTNPAFSPYVPINPTTAQQSALIAAAGLPAGTFTGNFSGGTYDPANVYAIIDNRYSNTAIQQVSGFDLTIRYSMPAFSGDLKMTGNASWLDSDRRLTTLSVAQPTSDVIFFPAKFHGRLGLMWSRSPVSFSAALNHVGGVTDNSLTPAVEGSAMTTVDFTFDYNAKLKIVGEIGLRLSMLNAFNREPPYMKPLQSYHTNYDSTNYSALGRVINITLTKRF